MQKKYFLNYLEIDIFSKLDLSTAYWQEFKSYITFVTHKGLYQFETMPFGLVIKQGDGFRIIRKRY